MAAYYNEIDPKVAAWLRELIRRDVIAPGEVDERSIEDVIPSELRQFNQCHFFAGIGTWSYALRAAGWPDDRPIWTGSCPCQPFSSAGKGEGFVDERHLWPAFHWLIQKCRPDIVFGEQVAKKAGKAWFDLVSTDLERDDYACGPIIIPACGFGASHQRERIYWVADAGRKVSNSKTRLHLSEENGKRSASGSCGLGDTGGLAHPTGIDGPQYEREPGRRSPSQESHAPVGSGDTVGGVADAKHARSPRAGHGAQHQGAQQQPGDGCDAGSVSDNPGPLNGFWRDADWLRCRDGKWRPVEPGSFPLADGAPARVVRLRGYGNAIVAPQAQGFIEVYMASFPAQAGQIKTT